MYYVHVNSDSQMSCMPYFENLRQLVGMQNLIGWWPLNGDANDYSGNNNGQATNVQYTNTWISTYSAP